MKEKIFEDYFFFNLTSLHDSYHDPVALAARISDTRAVGREGEGGERMFEPSAQELDFPRRLRLALFGKLEERYTNLRLIPRLL